MIMIYFSILLQQEFISALISTCIEKIKCSLQQISSRESLFSHLVDEVLSFDEEIRSSYNYPFSGCSSTLITKPYLEQWLHIEKKCELYIHLRSSFISSTHLCVSVSSMFLVAHHYSPRLTVSFLILFALFNSMHFVSLRFCRYSFLLFIERS